MVFQGIFLSVWLSNLGYLGSDRFPIGAATLPPEGLVYKHDDQHYMQALGVTYP